MLCDGAGVAAVDYVAQGMAFGDRVMRCDALGRVEVESLCCDE